MLYCSQEWLSLIKITIPTGAARFLEPLVIFVRDEIAIPNIGHKYKRFMGYF
jgi:F-type H+-transporting ATPase subunit a